MTSVDVDAQDRLMSWGDLAYTYTDHGTLASRTDTSTSATTTYSYDPPGALREVDLPDGTVVTYGVDALGRRVSRSMEMGSGPVVTHRYLYHGSRLVAEVDGSGTVTSRYVYASRGHVPDLLLRGGSPP
jgi:YD repeat-containing protein